jgi:hypothetical protein
MLEVLGFMVLISCIRLSKVAPSCMKLKFYTSFTCSMPQGEVYVVGSVGYNSLNYVIVLTLWGKASKHVSRLLKVYDLARTDIPFSTMILWYRRIDKTEFVAYCGVVKLLVLVAMPFIFVSHQLENWKFCCFFIYLFIMFLR